MGGQLEATTFRPNRQFSNIPQQQNFLPFVQQQPQHFLTPQQIYIQQQQQQQAQQRIDQNIYQPQQRQPVPYTPLNLQQRQYQEQLAYNQFLQRRFLEEQQIKAQLNRQHNRFDIGTGGQNAYVPFG